MQRGLERRLARAEAGAGEIQGHRDAERARAEYLRFRERMVETIRAGLIRAGLDPADAACLNREPEPTPYVPPASPAGDDPIDELEWRFARYIDCARDEPPDLAQASMAELYAVYCLGVEADGEGEAEAAEASPPPGTETGRYSPAS